MKRRASNPFTAPLPSDLSIAIKSFIQGDPKDGFPRIYRLATEQHIYWQQWMRLRWDIATLQSVVDIMKRYELNELQFHGKTVYVVTMMLRYGIDASNLPADSPVLSTLIETLLRLILEYPIYQCCFLLLDLLITEFSVSVRRIFEIGCTILEQLPTLVSDDNFIALLHFAADHSTADMDAKTLSLMLRLLASASGHIVGEFKSNFFLPRCFHFFTLGLDIKYCQLDGENQMEEVTWHCLRLLRIIACVHPCSNIELASSTVLHQTMILLSANVSEKVLREALSLLSTLASSSAQARSQVACIVTLELLQSLASKKMITIYDMLVEVFLTVYEMKLPYDDVRLRYTLAESTAEGQLISFILSEIASLVASIVQNDASEDMVASAPLPMELLARTLDKLERSLRILSAPNSFLSVKHSLLSILAQVFKEPSRFSTRYMAAIDVLLLLVKGSSSCWDCASPDPLDADFLHLSHRLVEDFAVLANHKIFDNRDRNSLHYLSGSDELTTIQNMIISSSQGSASSPIYSTCSLSRANSFAQKARDAASVSQERYLEQLCKLLNHIVRDYPTIIHISSHWEQHSVETNSKRLLYLYLLSGIVGWDKLQRSLPDVSDLPGQVLALLAEERFAMKRMPGMEKKCIELLGTWTEALGSFGIGSNDLCQYLLKVISSKPEGLMVVAGPADAHRQSSNSELMVRGHVSDAGIPAASSNSLSSTPGEALDHFDLHAAAMSTLIVLANADRGVRRKLVSSITDIIQSLFYFSPGDAINHRPVLHLVDSMAEFMSKVELNAEEAIVSGLIRSLNSPLAYLKVQACDLIYSIGRDSPGFIYRGVSRLEVESTLIEVFKQAPTVRHPQLLMAALKACSVLVHNPNVKPVWLPLPWLYHWSVYTPSLQQRILLSVQGISLIINVLKSVDVEYRLPVFTYTLSVASSLMYACVDDVLRAVQRSDEACIKALKDTLIANILPWLPIAMDFITLGKKRKKVRDHSDSSATATAQLGMNQKGEHMERTAQQLLVLQEDLEEEDKQAFVVKLAHANAVDGMEGTLMSSATPWTVKGYSSQAVEALTEKTMEALFAFLCTDSMIPLATYLTYIRLFEQSPLIASVSYFMTENKSNVRILRRGIDFIRYFADNEMNLSIIAMHTPAALMSAIQMLKDTFEVQISFCKVILIVAKMNDDFARENFIRFKVHMALIDMVKAQHAQLSVLATQALSALAANEANLSNMITSSYGNDSGLVDAVLLMLETLPKSLHAQVEGLQALIWFDTVMPELVSTSPKKNSIFAVMRKARKTVTQLSKKPSAEVDAEKLQALLDHAFWKNASCIVS